MKKILVLSMLLGAPSFIYTMESLQTISSPEAKSNIERSLLDSSTRIEMASQNPEGTRIAILTNEGDVILYDGSGEYLGVVAKGKEDAKGLEFNPDGTKVILQSSRGPLEFSSYRRFPDSSSEYGRKEFYIYKK